MGDRRAPLSVLVFVDGDAVPFQGARPPVDADNVAYYRRPRAEYLSLQIPMSARVTIVNHAPLVALSLTWSGLREAPPLLLAPFALLLVGGAVAYGSRRTWMVAPRISLALASGMLVVWLVGGFHLQPWGPVVLVLEIAALAGVVVARGAAPPEDPALRPAG